MRLLSDQSSVDHLNAIVEEELEVHLFCEHDWEINDAELNTSTPFLSLLGSVVQDHDEGELDLWTVRSDTDDELSDDDDEEIQNARKKLAIFREEDELFEKGRSKLSRNVNANWDCGKENDGQLSEYGDSSDPESLIESGHDEDGNGKRKNKPKGMRYNPNTKPEDTNFFVGQEFVDASEFKKALSHYCICHARDIVFKKNMYSRVGARCKDENCSWRIWASKIGSDHGFKVKTYFGEHICGRLNYVHALNSTWIAENYLPKFRVSPIWKVQDIRNTIWAEYGLQVGFKRCLRGREKAWDMLFGQYKEQYEHLPDYAAEILRANPENTVKIKCDNNVFERLYICFSSLRKGFLQECRPFICLDGCFLKGPFGGQLLSAVGRDGNNHMFPIAWAVVESENKLSWSWFLNLLADDLGTVDGTGYTLMSDQQKGLMNAIANVWASAEQRCCARHVYANIRGLYGGAEIRKRFLIVAKSTTTNTYEKAIEDVQKISMLAADDLLKRHPERWCRAFFTALSSCDSVDNNMVEVFNAYILSSRHKPIISMLEDIREAMQERLHRKRDFIAKNNNVICPRIGWQLSGIPCLHAVTAIWANGEKPENYVAHWFQKQQYLKAYTFVLEPLNGSEEWPRSSGPAIYAPSSKRPIACRPTKKRKREAGETKSKNTQPEKLSRKGTPIRCSKCGQLGHNQSRCNASCTPNISQRKGKHVTSSDTSKNTGEQSATTSKQTIRNKNRTAAASKKTQTSSLACTPMHNRGVGLYNYPNGYQVYSNIFATKASTPEVTANFHIRNQSSSREEVNLAGHKNSLTRQLLR